MASPRFYRPGGYSPPPPEVEEPGLLSRGLNRLGQIAGTAGRGIDTLVNVGRGLAEEGDPLARFKLTPESQGRGLAGDIGGAVGVVDPSIDQETVGSQIAEGAFGRPSEQDSYGTAIGREATRFVGDLARDPLTFVAGLGLGSKVAGGQKASRLLAEVPDMAPELARALSGAARTGQRAATAERIASGAFQGLMAGGAYEGGRAAYRTIRDEGFTPKAAGEATGALLAAGGLVLPHLRHRDAGMAPDELSRITQILPNVTADELGRREAFYSRRGMNEAVKAVQDEVARRNQILPKDSAGNISEGARVAVDAAEAMKVAEAPPTARTDTAGPYQAFLNRDVRPEPIPAATDAPFAADPPEQAYADFFARLESIKTPEEAQALVGEQADTALQAARKAGIPVAENQDALPARPVIPGPDGGVGTLEGVTSPVAGGDQIPMGIAEAPVVEAPGVPTPASIAGNRAPAFVKLPAERLLWEQAVEAGVSPEQASKSIATPRGRSLLRDAVRGQGIPPVLPPGEKRLPAWEGALFDPRNAPPSRPALIEQQAQAFAAEPEAAQVFGDAARVVEAKDAQRLVDQATRRARKARAREKSMAEAERVLAVNAPQRLPLVPEPPVRVEAETPSPVLPVPDSPSSPVEAVPPPGTETKYSVQPNQMGFYSQLQRVTEKLPQAMKGADLFRYLSDPKRGVKADELKWTGLDDFLRERAGQKVTPKDVQDFLAQNEVQVKEVAKGATTSVEGQRRLRALEAERRQIPPAGERTEAQRRRVAEIDAEAERLGDRVVAQQRESGETKFSQYQLPGGENYREVLLTLPQREGSAMREAGRRLQEAEAAERAVGPEEVLRRGDLTEATDRARAEFQRARETQGAGTFRGGHYEEPNILAHVRFNDRVDADGKKVLFLEELQSDWAQKGRREGFKAEKTDTTGWTVKDRNDRNPYSEFGGNREFDVFDENGTLVDTVYSESTPEAAIAYVAASRDRRSVPSAPFVGKTEGWTELALKRMLRYAAENGYDRIAWTTGEQQAARYDLSKQVNAIYYKKNPDGTYHVFAEHKTGGGSTNLGKALKASELEGAIGKDVAARITSGEGVETNLGGGGTSQRDIWTSLTGDNLKVGGEGMKGYYDQIVPAVASKIGKKFGAKVGQTRIGTGPLEYSGSARIASNGREYWVEAGGRRLTGTFDSAAQAMDARDGLKNQQQPVHSIDVTPQMRESVVKEGLPLFATSPAGKSTPRPLVLDDVQANFRGRKVEPTETGFSVQLPNGRRILVEHSGAIDFSPEALKAGHGERVAAGVSEGTQKIAGAYRRVGGESVIQVAEQGILPHEVLHAFMDHVASPKERRLLEQQYAEKAKGEGRDWEEVAADDYKDYFNRRRAAEAEGKTVVEKGLFERLWAKFYEFFRSAYRSIAPNKEWIQEQLYAGKPWERESQQPARETAGRLATAYHGTPHEFDRFDMNQVGTGEGAQAYGHGLYFAENPSVAEAYRMAGQGREFKSVSYEGVDYPLGSDRARLLADIKKQGKERALSELRSEIKRLQNYAPDRAEALQGELRYAQEVDPSRVKVDRGALYTVDVPDAAIAKMLDWDVPLTQQPGTLEAFVRAGLPLETIQRNRLTGQGAYETLAAQTSKREASAALREAGLSGIKYLDQGSRNGGGLEARWSADGKSVDVVSSVGVKHGNFPSFREADAYIERVGPKTRNYVVFDDATPRVLSVDRYSAVPSKPTAPQTPTPAVPTTPEATLGEKVVEGYKSGLVSGPGTQVANIVGNVGEQGVRSAETLASSIVDRLLPGERQRFTGETRAELSGLFSKMPQAMGQLSKDLKDVFTLAPETVDPTAPIERRQGAITGKTGRTVRIPFRLLGAFDNFFGTIGKEAELQKLAFRQAKSELKNADAATVKARAQEIAQNPSEALLKETERAKASRLFKGDPENPDEVIQALMTLRNKIPLGLGHLTIPFLETPAHIAKLTIQRSPAGFIQGANAYRVYKAAVKKGADQETIQKLRGEAVDALARPLLGTALTGIFYGIAKTGSMTGSGPTDLREKALLRQTGWQPYSFVVGEGDKKTYIPFNRFEPVSSFLGFAADAAESNDAKDQKEFASKALGSVMTNLTSKTYLQGIADAAEFWTEPFTAGEKYLSSVASGAVPNIVAKTAQAIDPTVRETTAEGKGAAGLAEKIGQTLLSRIPGASSTLPARRSATGDPIQREGNAVSRFLSPVQASTRRPEMRLEELMVEAGEAPGQPSREFTVPGTGGKKVRLTDSEYAVLQEANLNAATSLRSRLGALERMDPEVRAKIIKQAYDRARESARARLMGNRGFRERARREVAV